MVLFFLVVCGVHGWVCSRPSHSPHWLGGIQDRDGVIPGAARGSGACRWRGLRWKREREAKAAGHLPGAEVGCSSWLWGREHHRAYVQGVGPPGVALIAKEIIPTALGISVSVWSG